MGFVTMAVGAALIFSAARSLVTGQIVMASRNGARTFTREDGFWFYLAVLIVFAAGGAIAVMGLGQALHSRSRGS